MTKLTQRLPDLVGSPGSSPPEAPSFCTKGSDPFVHAWRCFLPALAFFTLTLVFSLPTAWAAPVVSITAPTQGSEVSKEGFAFSGEATSSSGIEEVRVYVYVSGRGFTVTNQQARFDPATSRWRFDVSAGQIAPGKQVYLYVRAKDTTGQFSNWQRISVTVESDPNVDSTPPVVAIHSPPLGQEASKDGFAFGGTATDDRSGIEEVRVYVYDYGRRGYTVVNQLANYSAASGTWSFNVSASHISPGSQARLWVRAKDSSGNWARWQNRDVTVEADPNVDVQPPVVVIHSPPLGQEASEDGFVFGGTVTDEKSDVEEVRIYVYDYGQRLYTVRNQLANYDATSETWVFNVSASHITPGYQARLWVRAKDSSQNWSSWQYRNVPIEADPNADVEPPVVTISSPLLSEPASAEGFVFGGTITDEKSDIEEVRIYVYDYGQGRYTVQNQLANYESSSGTWSFNVLASHVTHGYSARLWVRGKDTSGNWAAWQNRLIPVEDFTAPTTPVVTDDGDYTDSATQLHATWTSSDPESDIAEYQYAIGTTAGGTDVVDWTSTGTSTEITHTGLALSHGATYYISVKARNGAGLWSSVGSSDGILVDRNPPVIARIDPPAGSTYTEGDVVPISVNAVDADGDPLEYQFLVAGMVRQPWTSVASWTWNTTGFVREHQLTIQVRDSFGRQVEQTQALFGYRRSRGTP